MSRGIFLALLCVACATEQDSSFGPQTTFATPFATQEAPASGDGALAALPQRLELDPRKVELGARLFRDLRVSGDGQLACIDCHAFDRGGANGQAHSSFPGRKPTAVNIPSLFNSAFNFRFGWAGNLEDIGQQLDAAMESRAAMAGTWDDATLRLDADPRVRRAFGRIYSDGLTPLNLREALAIYSLSLITPNSRFDRSLRGELELTPDERHGYDLFRDYGCVSCHQGINVGGNMLQRFGVMRDYFEGRTDLTAADQGLFSKTGREEDRYVFRVPSLRNVALTAPYFHDGSKATLEDAVTTMASYQLGRELDPQEARQMAAFLRTLSGELLGRPL
jgi:cytochrome c peroxidase